MRTPLVAETLVAAALLAGPASQAEAAPVQPITPSIEQLGAEAVAHTVNPVFGKRGNKTMQYTASMPEGGTVSVSMSSTRLCNGLPDPNFLSELQVEKYEAISFLGDIAIPVKSVRFSHAPGKPWNAEESTMVKGLLGDSRHTQVVGRKTIKKYYQSVTDSGIENYPEGTKVDPGEARSQFNRMERVAKRLLDKIAPLRRDIR